MRFELDIDRRNLSDQFLLDDIASVARRLGTESPTTEEYNKHGRFNSSTIIRRFDRWGNALTKANLKLIRHNGGIDVTVALADLRRVAELLQSDSVTTTEYREKGRFSPNPLVRKFGTWNEALRAAGLEPSRRYRVPDEELFENLEAMWRALGRQPSYRDVEKPFSKFAAGTYERRFGSRRKALELFVEYANRDSEESSVDERDTAAATAPEATPVPRRRQPSRAPNWRLRFLVMQRDGFRCHACGASPAATAGVKLQVDHRTPWSKGGETTLENLHTLCETCNIGKSNVCGGPAAD